jgi:hypothetical protein
MKNQAVVFSTRADREFFYNDALGQVPEGLPNVPSKSERTYNEWTWYLEQPLPYMQNQITQAILPSTINRGLVFRFNPAHQFPVSKIKVDAVDLPRFGMQSHFIGRVTLTVSLEITPRNNKRSVQDAFSTTTGFFNTFQVRDWTQPSSVSLIACWDGYDCDSPIEVLNKYLKVVLASFDPWGRKNMVQFVETSCGSINMILGPDVTVMFDIHDQGTDDSIYNFSQTLKICYFETTNSKKFFGQLTRFMLFTRFKDADPSLTGGPVCTYYKHSPATQLNGGNTRNNFPTARVHSLGRFTFPFASQVRLNARIVGSRMFDRNVSRNLQSASSNTVIATFPFSAQKSKSGYGAGINRNMYIKNPSKDSSEIEFISSFSHIHYMEFWFTQGSSDLPLYVPYGYIKSDMPTQATTGGYPFDAEWGTNRPYVSYDEYGPSVLIETNGDAYFSETQREVTYGGGVFRVQACIDSHDVNSPQVANRTQPIDNRDIGSYPHSYKKGQSFIELLASMELSVFMTLSFCDCTEDREAMYIDSNTYVNQKQ